MWQRTTSIYFLFFFFFIYFQLILNKKALIWMVVFPFYRENTEYLITETDYFSTHLFFLVQEDLLPPRKASLHSFFLLSLHQIFGRLGGFLRTVKSKMAFVLLDLMAGYDQMTSKSLLSWLVQYPSSHHQLRGACTPLLCCYNIKYGRSLRETQLNPDFSSEIHRSRVAQPLVYLYMLDGLLAGFCPFCLADPLSMLLSPQISSPPLFPLLACFPPQVFYFPHNEKKVFKPSLSYKRIPAASFEIRLIYCIVCFLLGNFCVAHRNKGLDSGTFL